MDALKKDFDINAHPAVLAGMIRVLMFFPTEILVRLFSLDYHVLVNRALIFVVHKLPDEKMLEILNQGDFVQQAIDSVKNDPTNPHSVQFCEIIQMKSYVMDNYEFPDDWWDFVEENMAYRKLTKAGKFPDES